METRWKINAICYQKSRKMSDSSQNAKGKFDDNSVWFVEKKKTKTIERIEFINFWLGFEDDSCWTVSVSINHDLAYGPKVNNEVMKRESSESCKLGRLTPSWLMSLKGEVNQSSVQVGTDEEMKMSSGQRCSLTVSILKSIFSLVLFLDC